MHENNLTKICETVMQIFTKVINEIDKEVKFAKRKSKLGARLFANSIILGCLSDKEISLEGMCRWIKEKKVKITKQGLQQRFNERAKRLMQEIFARSIKELKVEERKVIEILKPFSGIQILDSSGISLPNNLRNEYKGNGGAASEAGLKIQVLYDYLQGQIMQVEMTEGCRNDHKFEKHLDQIKKGILHLQDLGYFKIESFKKIEAQEGYFVSRYMHSTKVFSENEILLDLEKELKKGGKKISRKIKLGQEEKMEVRLIAFRMPEEEVTKRLRKMKEKAQKGRRRITKRAKMFANWSIYITNVPEDMLKDEEIYLIYSMRWQIELLFKLCKSEAGISLIRGKKITRILCEIYAKLTCVVILLYLCFPLRWRKDKELSFRKAYKELSMKAVEFFKVLRNFNKMKIFLKSFYSNLKDFAFKEGHRKKRKLSFQKLMDAVGQKVLA